MPRDTPFHLRGFKPLPDQQELPTSEKKPFQGDHIFEQDCTRLWIDCPDGKEYILHINPEGHLEVSLVLDRLVILPASSNTFQFRGEKDFADFPEDPDGE